MPKILKKKKEKKKTKDNKIAITPPKKRVRRRSSVSKKLNTRTKTSGILSVISRKFLPREGKDNPFPTKSGPSSSGIDGTTFGKFIHSQIEDYVNTKKNGLEFTRKLHPQSTAVLTLLATMNLSILDGESDVCWPQAFVQTPVDIICLDEQRRRVIIELKTLGRYTTGPNTNNDEKLLSPFQDISYTLKNKHFIQLLVTTILHDKQNPDRPAAASYLIYTDSQKAEAYTLPQQFKDRTKETELALITKASSKKKTQKMLTKK